MNRMSYLDKQIEHYLQETKQTGGLRHLDTIYSSSGKWLSAPTAMGVRLNLSGNDYLGIADRPDLREQFSALYPQYHAPSGSTSSRLLLGNFEEAIQLEQEIASALQHESALLFNSGYHLNTAILPSLSTIKGIKIYADRMIHASMIDGIRLSKLPFVRFRHNDLNHLTQLLEADRELYPLPIVMVESLYSMDGDQADLKALVRLKQTYPNLIIYCDEAHAIGTHGAHGYGLAEELEVLPSIDILVGTFGKALNSMGAYVATSAMLRDYLINRARPLIFSTMLPPASVAWSRYIFQTLPTLTSERAHLRATSQALRSALQEMDYATPGVAHIVPIIRGDNDSCCALATVLSEGGFEVRPIRYPTVAQGTARIRLSLTASIRIEDLLPMLDILAHQR